MIFWIKDALQRIQLEPDVFDRTILKKPELLLNDSEVTNESNDDDINNEDYELIQEEDYEFVDID